MDPPGSLAPTFVTESGSSRIDQIYANEEARAAFSELIVGEEGGVRVSGSQAGIRFLQVGPALPEGDEVSEAAIYPASCGQALQGGA